MSHPSPGSTKPSGAVPKHDDLDSLTNHVGVVIGITTGASGALFTVGLTVLPKSTLPEQGLDLLACAALSVAVFGGIGAWRSIRRFILAGTSVCLAIVCLASLSIVAQGNTTAQANAVAQGDSGHDAPQTPQGTPPGTPSPSVQPSATVTPTATSTGAPVSARPGTSQPLTNMSPVNTSDTTYSVGMQQVNAKQYQQAIYDSYTGDNDDECDGSVTDATNYNLNYKFTNFHAIVGLAETASPGYSITFTVLLDGQQKYSVTISSIEKIATIDISVSKVLRITLEDTCQAAANNDGSSGYLMPSGDSVTAVWANPTVTG